MAVGPCFKAVLEMRQHAAQHPVDQGDSQVHGEDFQGSLRDQLRLAKHLRHLNRRGHGSVFD